MKKRFEVLVCSAVNPFGVISAAIDLRSDLRCRFVNEGYAPPRVQAWLLSATQAVEDRWPKCTRARRAPGDKPCHERSLSSSEPGEGVATCRRLLVRGAMLLMPTIACLAICTASSGEDSLRKVGPELCAVYQACTTSRQTGRPLVLPNPRIRVVEDRVLEDVVASGDVGDVKVDLIALGMRNAETAGRIVSRQLPIAAIPSLAVLPSLKFARAAITAPHVGAGHGAQWCRSS